MVDERLLFSNCVLNENRLWYISNQGYLMYMDVISGKVSYASIKNGNDWVKHPMSDPMFVYEGGVYWVDQFGKAVHEYNIGTEEYCLYELPETERLDSCYAGIFMFADKLYMFPKKTQKLLVFDLKKKKAAVREEIYEDFLARQKNKNNFGLTYAVQYRKYIYIFLKDMETVWEVDLTDCTYRTLRLPQKITDIRCAVCADDVMYIMTLNGSVYVWNVENDCFCGIYECQNKGLSFSRMIVAEHKLFMLPALSEKILIMDMEDKSVSETNHYPNDLQYRESNWDKYWGYAEDDQQVWFATRTSNYMLIINKKEEKIEWKKIIPPTSREEYDFCKSIKRLQPQKNKEILLQERLYGMIYFLFLLTEQERERAGYSKEDYSAGMAIWRTTKE